MTKFESVRNFNRRLGFDRRLSSALLSSASSSSDPLSSTPLSSAPFEGTVLIDGAPVSTQLANYQNVRISPLDLDRFPV